MGKSAADEASPNAQEQGGPDAGSAHLFSNVPDAVSALLAKRSGSEPSAWTTRVLSHANGAALRAALGVCQDARIGVRADATKPRPLAGTSGAVNVKELE
ncbi:hypothetical protein, partial [Thioalkalivibrio sp.]|uniref:hypothetical protein n=1 Tax=Thioalkalivibrio sp. TaxID=2093813 RepID=UPI003975535C